MNESSKWLRLNQRSQKFDATAQRNIDRRTRKSRFTSPLHVITRNNAMLTASRVNNLIPIKHENRSNLLKTCRHFISARDNLLKIIPSEQLSNHSWSFLYSHLGSPEHKISEISIDRSSAFLIYAKDVNKSDGRENRRGKVRLHVRWGDSCRRI